MSRGRVGLMRYEYCNLVVSFVDMEMDLEAGFFMTRHGLTEGF